MDVESQLVVGAERQRFGQKVNRYQSDLAQIRSELSKAKEKAARNTMTAQEV